MDCDNPFREIVAFGFWLVVNLIVWSVVVVELVV